MKRMNRYEIFKQEIERKWERVSVETILISLAWKLKKIEDEMHKEKKKPKKEMKKGKMSASCCAPMPSKEVKTKGAKK